VPTIRSIRAPLVHEIPKIKGSRFIAAAAPIADRAGADAWVAARREADPQATHHCFAFRLGRDENDFRFADDGEPSGTAGRPILKEIDGRDLTDVIVVVARYFGGTKLGSGGLVRAYGGAAAAAFDHAEIVEQRITAPLCLGFAYGRLGAVQGVLAGFDLAPTESAYGEEVRLTLAVPVEELARVRTLLTDATAGCIRFES
jgi:uncharacterized YigZ family protein